MKAKIQNVIDHGVASGSNSERIVIDILEDTDMVEYLVLDTTYSSDGKISNKIRHPFWFPATKVKKNDVVVLYTKKGSSKPILHKDNSTTYFFYWGLDSFVWNNDGDVALLLHIDTKDIHKILVPKKKSL